MATALPRSASARLPPGGGRAGLAARWPTGRLTALHLLRAAAARGTRHPQRVPCSALTILLLTICLPHFFAGAGAGSRALWAASQQPDTAKHRPRRASTPAPGETLPPAALPSTASTACSVPTAPTAHRRPCRNRPLGPPAVSWFARHERAANAAPPACVRPLQISAVFPTTTATTATTAHTAHTASCLAASRATANAALARVVRRAVRTRMSLWPPCTIPATIPRCLHPALCNSALCNLSRAAARSFTRRSTAETESRASVSMKKTKPARSWLRGHPRSREPRW